jgi:hypothetical protein
MDKQTQPRWRAAPEEHDYPAARSYLSLIFDPEAVERYVQELKSGAVAQFKAKDIFRASGLSLLGVSNSHVEKDRAKIRSGAELSPLLLVRDPAHGRVIIADGPVVVGTPDDSTLLAALRVAEDNREYYFSSRR